MQLRGRITKGLLVALIFTLVPVTAFSAQKITPGSNCKVNKQKVTFQGKIYTCVKSGKKLVWNKGVVVSKPSPAPTVTVTATPAPAPTVTVTATPAPTVTKPATPSPTLTPKVATYAPVQVSLKSGKMGDNLDFTYLSPINWGGLPANSSAVMIFPVTLKSSVDANIIRVLVSHTDGVQKIVVDGNWNWEYVKAGDTKVLNLTIPLAYLQEERFKGYSGGYSFKISAYFKDSSIRDTDLSIPIDFVLPTQS